jgi:hypothetical protein
LGAAALPFLALALTGGAGPAQGAGACSKVAAPWGSDSSAGTQRAPYATLQRLARSLGPGQVGCLRAGSYGGRDVYLTTPGTTLQSYPGERATITAFVEVKPTAAHTRLSGLRFDTRTGSNVTGTKLQADDTVFSGNEVTKGGRGICLIAGSQQHAARVVIERNRFFDCGPPGSKYDHDIYLVHTRSAVVRWNVMSSNRGGWAVHLYPDADGTVVEHNVIDGNYGGVVFAGEGGATSDNNVVRNNAITFSSARGNVEGSWSGGPLGHGNSVYRNCFFSAGPRSPSGVAGGWGFAASGNVVLRGSPYADRGRGDYRFRKDSPCRALVGDVAGGAVPGARAASARPRLVLKSRRSRVRAGHRLRLRGRLAGRKPARRTRVALQVRRRGHWRTVARRRLRRSGAFAARVRTHRVRQGRAIRLRAVVRGVARSRTVRVRVSP